MTDYSKMSDFDVNCAVARGVGLDGMMFFDVDSSLCHGPVWSVPSGVSDDGFNISRGNPFNPCNNPADAWPIIAENMISICAYQRANPGMVRESWWEADKFGEHITRDKNPLRAAMIVFLIMQENSK